MDEFTGDIHRPKSISSQKHSLGFELRGWHMHGSDVLCMMDHALDEPYVPTTDPVYPTVWTAEQLNGYAAICDIDFSELWYEIDRPGFIED